MGDVLVMVGNDVVPDMRVSIVLECSSSADWGFSMNRFRDSRTMKRQLVARKHPLKKPPNTVRRLALYASAVDADEGVAVVKP